MKHVVAEHYSNGSLLDLIRSGLEELELSPDNATVDNLAPVDEFHVGGREATVSFVDQLRLSEKSHVLDIGCGLGGTARFVASQYGSRVTGIDLTQDYIDTGNTLCKWVGLDKRISLVHGSALDLPFDESRFTGAYMLHVGMNIRDKEELCREVGRALRPGSLFGIYDLMVTGNKELTFPVPWSSNSATNHAASPADYETALRSSGFRVVGQQDRRKFAVGYYERMRANAGSRDGPPALGLHLLMGTSTKTKLRNMLAGITSGAISPVEIIAEKQ